MRRRHFLGASFALPAAAHAQSSSLPRIAYLSGRALATDAYLQKAFLEGLAAAGYVEGRNVTIDARWADGNYDRLPALATELVKSRPALLVTVGGTAVPIAAKAAAKAAGSSLPIAFAIGADPAALGLVDTLARPGGNMTGMTLLASSLEGKRIDLLRAMLPAAKSVALLVNPEMPGVADQIGDAERAARALGLGLQVLKAKSAAELDTAFASLGPGTDGLAIAIDGFFISQRARIVALAAARRLPMICPVRDFADAGGLTSYGAHWPDVYRALGSYAGRILKGALPKDLPVQEPNNYELVVNLKTAKALGLTLPPTFVGRADEVIE